ncbi:MAG: 7-dehydrocholesterol reductase [Polyangiaceae bacterium]|nr:7-dehydrocholesterol reductase [Polyangiaceae bacterium]
MHSRDRKPPAPHPGSAGRDIVRRWLGPALLILVTPWAALACWVIIAKYDGSVLAFAAAFTPRRFVGELPRPSFWAAAVVLGWSAWQWALLRWLPGETFEGPPMPTGGRPRFKRNGILAWIASHALLIAGFATGIFSGVAFQAHFGEILVALVLGAHAVCAVAYLKALYAPSTSDRVRTGSFLLDYFQGIELHPTLPDGTNLKQLLNARISMLGWSAIVVSFCAYQYETIGRLTSALYVSSALVVVYLYKFILWEEGYCASLDMMHDRFGYYIVWGVLAWVPAVYPIAQFYLSTSGHEVAPSVAAFCLVFGLLAMATNYDADAQRQAVRASQGRCLIWGRPAKVIPATYTTADGHRRQNLLLASGYWGLARHFHYVPELATALAWTLPCGFTRFAPYFYVVFLGTLLVDRPGRDDRRCLAKYGEAWRAYRRCVPYKIVPSIY